MPRLHFVFDVFENILPIVCYYSDLQKLAWSHHVKHPDFLADLFVLLILFYFILWRYDPIVQLCPTYSSFYASIPEWGPAAKIGDLVFKSQSPISWLNPSFPFYPIIINWCLETHDNTTGFHRPCWFRMIDWTMMFVKNFFIFECFLLRLPYSTNYAPFWK